MKTSQALIALILLFAGSAAIAEGYSCPAGNDSRGGWSPPECGGQPLAVAVPASSGWYACPAENSTAGGWLPLECVPSRKAVCADCGTVEAVNVIETDAASGLGAVAGAVAGGVLGSQVGKGKGKAVSAVIGAVGGGVAGHYGEKYLRKKNRWDMIIQMDDGTHRTLSFDAAPNNKPGDKVRVRGNSLVSQ